MKYMNFCKLHSVSDRERERERREREKINLTLGMVFGLLEGRNI